MSLSLRNGLGPSGPPVSLLRVNCLLSLGFFTSSWAGAGKIEDCLVTLRGVIEEGELLMILGMLSDVLPRKSPEVALPI